MSAYRNMLWVGMLAAWLGAGAVVHAQQSVEPSGITAEQETGLARQGEQMRQAGWQVMHMMDFGQMGEVWDQASQMMKNMVPREEFVRQVFVDRVRLGAVGQRRSPEVTRSRSDGSHGVPAGLYISVISTTTFTNQAEDVLELVTFRFDEDQVWRVTGYSLR